MPASGHRAIYPRPLALGGQAPGEHGAPLPLGREVRPGGARKLLLDGPEQAPQLLRLGSQRRQARLALDQFVAMPSPCRLQGLRRHRQLFGLERLPELLRRGRRAVVQVRPQLLHFARQRLGLRGDPGDRGFACIAPPGAAPRFPFQRQKVVVEPFRAVPKTAKSCLKRLAGRGADASVAHAAQVAIRLIQAMPDICNRFRQGGVRRKRHEAVIAVGRRHGFQPPLKVGLDVRRLPFTRLRQSERVKAIQQRAGASAAARMASRLAARRS